MQIAAMRTSDHTSFDGYPAPVRSSVERCRRQPRLELVERCTSLLSAGIARAPAYERNEMLTSLFGQEAPDLATVRIAEAVVGWLSTGRVVTVPSKKRGAHETHTMATLLRDAWRKYPELKALVVEGSPEAPSARTFGNLRPLRRTHHSVLLRMGGRLYVIDGARGLVFDSLRAYLSTVMLPGRRGGPDMRMKWFRVLDGGLEMGQDAGESVN